MSFKESIEICFHKFAIIDGKASRSEYWWWQLFFFLVCLVGFGVDYILKLDNFLAEQFDIILVIPNFAVSIRRCHDTNHSGWWLLCPIYNLVLMLISSSSEDLNK